MANIDFSKVERLFDLGISDYEAQNIQYLAVIANSMGEFFDDELEAPMSEEQKRRAREIICFHIKRELKYIATHNKALLRRLGMAKQKVEKLIEDPHTISDEDWQFMNEVREALKNYREEIRNKLLEQSAQEEVERQLKRSRSFRFNIRDHWLPME